MKKEDYLGKLAPSSTPHSSPEYEVPRVAQKHGREGERTSGLGCSIFIIYFFYDFFFIYLFSKFVKFILFYYFILFYVFSGSVCSSFQPVILALHVSLRPGPFSSPRTLTFLLPQAAFGWGNKPCVCRPYMTTLIRSDEEWRVKTAINSINQTSV